MSNERQATDDVKPAEHMLFEVAWEVCRQVGGIYTVLRSKAPSVSRRLGDRYCLVGPYDPEISPLEFEPHHPAGAVGHAVAVLRQTGFEAYYGRWLVSGQPQVVLLNPRSAWDRLPGVKYELRERQGISCAAGEALVDEVLAFGHLVHRFFQALAAAPALRWPVVAHFHEWLASSAIPALRREELPVSIVFTTHATSLGRHLAPQDPWFYDHLPFVDLLADARRFGIETQVRLERDAAHGAHLLTTVSDITALECEHLLGRKPDLLLPNGLNIERFTAVHEFQNLHLQYKEKIHEFVMAHFFPSYKFDLGRTLYFFSSGRFEYRNKGFDLTLDALARLNGKLKSAELDRTVVFFLITRRPCRGPNAEVLRRGAMLAEIRANCEAIKDVFAKGLFHATARGETADYNALVDSYWRLRLQRLMHAWSADCLPIVVTHDLVDDAEDPVLKQLRHLDLINREEDPVKVVYHPAFVSPTDLPLGMDYDQFVRGCHLGIFPSFYEPWGYTPLECVARGIPAATSDLCGFGRYLLQQMPNGEKRGILVVRRREQSFEAASEQLAEALLRFCRFESRERIELRNQVESYAAWFDWEVLGQQYATAHGMARRRSGH